MEREFYLKIITLLLLTTVIACDPVPQTTSDCDLPTHLQKQESDSGDIGEEQRTCVIPEQEQTANMQINAILQDFNPEQEAKMQEALRRLELVINSVEFKQRILNHEYNGERTFVDNGGLTNEEIYEVIMEASEDLDPGVDEEIDVDLTLYYANNSTVGYTYPNTMRIWVNNKFFSTNSLGKVAANVAHEWTHKLGFEHDFNRTSSRAYSVPYAVGTIIRELVDNM